jgi:membrane protein
MAQTSPPFEYPGNSAATPLQIPLGGWLQIAKRVWQQLGRDNVQIVSAGVAFYFFLSLFPAVAAFLSLYGLIMSPDQAAQQISQLEPLIPKESYRVIANFADALTHSETSSLGWGVVLSIFLSVVSANKGTTALFTGLNIAYNQTESRPFLRRTLLTFGVTLGTLVTGSLLLALVAVIPALSKGLPLPDVTNKILNQLRWPLIVVIGFAVLAFLYKVVPNRTNPQWRWVTPGSIVAVLLWLLGSAGFGWYIDSFVDMSKTYGGLAAIVVLMLWFFITAYAILLGAEVNSESEYQTMRDSTIGPEKPMGSRGAYHADHVVGGDETGRNQAYFQ